MNRRAVIALSASAVLAACVGTGPRARAALAPGSTLILLRHTEREGDALTPEGHARAAALVPALSGLPIDAIYTTTYNRNLQTAAPLATARGLAVERLTADNPVEDLVTLGAGRSIVWIGNTTNLDPIWDDLGAPGAAPVEYGDLFILRPGSPPMVERRHFGA
ncbi:histidine phosphatase family protein [Rhodobacterales bacterium HKCCE2091]|nr:histidine phosphatase family protein [Rhodobacterales bacterium HKCCE2091]